MLDGVSVYGKLGAAMPFVDYTTSRMWSEARALTVAVYGVSNRFPSHECYGLRSQVRRAAVSVMANIAEGMGRNTNRDTIQFLFIARGSAHEVMCHCLIASDLGYGISDDLMSLVQRYKGLAAGIMACAKRMSPQRTQTA